MTMAPHPFRTLNPEETHRPMRIPDWTPERHPQPSELVEAIRTRRGGELLNLDKALLWSEPIARGWNIFMRDVRVALGVSRRLRELGICTVALVSGAHYEFHHHGPDFMREGGTPAQLDALQRHVGRDGASADGAADFDPVDWLIVRFAAEMTRDVKVSDTVFAEMRTHFDSAQIVELTTAFAAYNMVARILATLDIQPEHG